MIGKEENRLLPLALVLFLLFGFFLLFPLLRLSLQSFQGEGILSPYREILSKARFWKAAGNSLIISVTSGILTTVLAFGLACAVHYTRLPGWYKKLISRAAVLPMLLPTITYGFAIIYSFGKQGLVTKIMGRQLFEIYGFGGLLMGYVIYTLPVSFLLLHNTIQFIDKKFMLVSRVMGDSPAKTMAVTVIRPLIGTFAASFIQCFFLSFTDYGIPASVGGKFEVLASVLYNEMLGSIPNFSNGAVIALMMLLPSVFSILLIRYLERYNVRYHRITEAEPVRNRLRDFLMGSYCGLILLTLVSVFAVILLIPFVKGWPYDLSFSTQMITRVFTDSSLLGVYKNSILTAVLTALAGTLIAYGAALLTTRSNFSKRGKKAIEGIAVATNTIPGMVLGIAFLLAFRGSPLQNTLMILILCNIVHFFSTPYLMLKASLEKMNASWEQTAKLMGDTWIQTVARIITPNALPALLEVFSYYFVNAMVTVSAVIFLAGSKTMVMTAKIKELQHFAKFDEIFVLSIFILGTNIAAKFIIQKAGRQFMKRKSFRFAMAAAAMLLVTGVMSGCGNEVKAAENQVIIHSNADDEAVEAMKKALDENGYEGRYLFQTFGTSELGGKLLAEGSDIEADLVTMSSYYLESAQEQNNMFQDLTFDTKSLSEYPAYYSPITAQEGAILINPGLLEENKLKVPSSLKELADPMYSGYLSVVDIQSSSTAWLMIQALLDNYQEEEAKEILSGIYQNAGVHIESSGSGPIKKVRAGEAAVGFGLRHQAIADEAEGLPVSYSDPEEGNYILTESLAVIDKKENTNPLAMEMAECILTKARPALITTYPIPLYEGEKADGAAQSGNPKYFAERLTAELLKKHQEISEECKAAAN